MSLHWLRGKPLIEAAVFSVIVLSAVFAPFIAPSSPLQIDLTQALAPPFYGAGATLEHPLGTDNLGRDILSRLIWGGRVSLLLAFGVILLGGTVGTVLGLISGYLSGLVDALIQRGVEAILSLPTIMIALVFVMVVGQSESAVLLILSPFVAARFARMVRGEALSIRESSYVALARVAGASKARILGRHILPNVASTVIVIATLEVGHMILLEASLGFLGVGVPPPTPEWGLMISEGRQYFADQPWLAMFPGLAIMATVLSLNSIGDWLRDVLDPKLQHI